MSRLIEPAPPASPCRTLGCKTQLAFVLLSGFLYLAGSFVLLLAVMTVIGVLISDIALAFLDPRIRLGGSATR